MKSAILLAAGLCLAVGSDAEAQGRGNSTNPSIRFQAMDVNSDGVITRQEWRGNDASFRNNDWNNDGILSGDEVRPGARRQQPTGRRADPAVERDTDWTDERFRALDVNRDGRVARREWDASAEVFTRIDRNRDNFLSAAEFKGEEDDARADRNTGADRFGDLDANRDGRLSRTEWQGSVAVFEALDANRDGTLTRAEAIGTEGGARDDFRGIDVNGDGSIARSEWHWNAAAFDRLDDNRDGRLTREEWDNTATPPAQENPAYRAGYDRGRTEGVQAGREDRSGPKVWDLEGQRELEQADSGYQPIMGNRADYQAGYRSGFRRGYREGFGPR
jgi:Ca2+-binding EF-hand superfamily protein